MITPVISVLSNLYSFTCFNQVQPLRVQQVSKCTVGLFYTEFDQFTSWFCFKVILGDVTVFADLEVIAVMVMIVSGVHGTLAFLLFYGVKEVRPTLVTEKYILVGKVQI